MRRQTGAGAIASLILTCVFGMTLLLSLATGAGVYRRVEERSEAGANTRLGLTYLSAKIHSHDSRGAVYAGRFGDVDAVYLTEGSADGDVYETVIYVYDGQLRELLRERDAALLPGDGESITAARSLTVEEPAENLLRLRFTDAAGVTETADIYLRSE